MINRLGSLRPHLPIRILPLPARPPAGADAGPEPDPSALGTPLHRVRAISCSGGGVRAAAFSLGGVQALSEPGTDGTPSYYASSNLMTSVSGGGYIAGSYAIIAHNLQGGAPDADLPVYAPGSPEDNRLRVHTRYLVDSTTQLAISVLGIVFGLMMNVLAIGAIAFIAATLIGYWLGKHGLDVLQIVDGGQQWRMEYPTALWGTLLAIFAVGALVYVAYRIVDTYRPLSDLATNRWCVAAISIMAGALAGATLFLGVPTLLVLLSKAPGHVHVVGFGPQGATLAGTATALVTIISSVVRNYLPKKDSNPTVSTVLKNTASLRTRLLSAVLPWLGSALVVGLVLLAMLTWVSNMASGRRDTYYWRLAIGAGIVLLLWQFLVDCNRTSLHRFYSQRLSTAFARKREGGCVNPPDQAFSSYQKLPGHPELVVCAAANTDEPGIVPSNRRCAPFTFSPHYSGLSSGTMFRGQPGSATYDLAAHEGAFSGQRPWNAKHAAHLNPDQLMRPSGRDVGLMMPTAALEKHASNLTLSDMIAVSGAAVAPAMGRMSRPSLRLLLGVADVRLGMWLPNPLHPRLRHAPVRGGKRRNTVLYRLLWQFRQPGLLALAREIFGGLTFRGHWLYVTDGGHYENLGLVEALRRGATEIVVFDAAGDAPFSLGTFGEAIETARTDLGVEVSMADSSPLRRDGKQNQAKALAAVATATYPNGVVATIYLCKAARVANLPLDVATWAAHHPSFPNDSTAEQFYGDREFEAYRCLGYAAGKQALELMKPQDAPPAPGSNGSAPRTIIAGAAARTEIEASTIIR